MPSTSTSVMCNASDSAGTSTPAASKGESQSARFHYIENINRFLADQDQRPPAGLGPVQTEDEAETAGEARASASIAAYKTQFSCDNESTAAKSTCAQERSGY